MASKPTPITLHRWHEALKVSRPAYVNFLITPYGAQDRAIARASADLAASFFKILGAI